jgi:hypothetical protein
MEDTGTPDNAPDPRAEHQLTLERLVVPARHAGILAVAVVLPFVTALGDRRWWVAALMVGFALLLLRRRTPKAV